MSQKIRHTDTGRIDKSTRPRGERPRYYWESDEWLDIVQRIQSAEDPATVPVSAEDIEEIRGHFANDHSFKIAVKEIIEDWIEKGLDAATDRLAEITLYPSDELAELRTKQQK
jgi:hypothetical protein